MPTKYGKDLAANRGFTADPAKVEAARAARRDIKIAKGRIPQDEIEHAPEAPALATTVIQPRRGRRG